MATPVNSIAATFSSVKTSTAATNTAPSLPTSLSLTSPNLLSYATAAAAASGSASWNPHSSLSWSHKSSLLDLYGTPGPVPLPNHRIRPSKGKDNRFTLRNRDNNNISICIGEKLPPTITLSYLDQNSASVKTVTLGALCRDKRRMVVIGVMAAFSPGCARFLRRVRSSEACRSANLIACVAPNDAFVMSAWGMSLATGGDWVGKVMMMMMSDGGGELFSALGVPRDLSPSWLGDGGVGGTKGRRFCLSVSHGIVTNLSFDNAEDADD